MRAYNIATYTFYLAVGSVMLRLAGRMGDYGPVVWGCALLVTGCSLVGVIGNVLLTDPPPVRRPETPKPTRIVEPNLTVKRYCGHVERWQMLCDDCIVNLATTRCAPCQIKRGREPVFAGCRNCPPVKGVTR